MEASGTIITALIADDESLARDVIKKYLSGFPQIKVLAECENGLIALNKINALQPDLVFLDIQMPELDGLSMLKEIKQLPMVIFITAYNQYAIKAFEINAIDYLLKPFDKERFAQAIQKAIAQKASPAYIQNQIHNLQKSLNELAQSDSKFINRILIKGKDGYLFIPVPDIYWFEAFSDYVKIHTKDKFYLKNVSLNELETKLNPQQFIRIHRSTIVNITCIKEMQPYFNGEYHLVLSNGEKLKLSRSYKDKIKSIIDETI